MILLSDGKDEHSRFDSVHELVRDVRLHGYYGGVRLVKATIKKFVEYCNRQGLTPQGPDFGYDQNLRQSKGDSQPELVLGRDFPLDEFADLAVDFPRLLGDFAAQVAIDLNDLQLRLGNLAGGLRGLRLQLSGFAFQARRGAFELGELGQGHELLLP